MTKKLKYLFVVLLLMSNLGYSQSKAISSAILNFGSNVCGNKTAVTFSLIGTPLTAPYLMTNCIINPPFNDVFNKYIAYNPKDNKVYINDINNGDSRLYIYDMGLPTTYICPAAMPLTPNYNYPYIPNNFEFDINGDVWSIRDLVDSFAIIERIDEATGTILFSKKISFPSTHIPNGLSSGDIVIIPNGRMFIVMGDNPGRFFEITNYNTGATNATANFIQDMPRPCYGIAYLNGKIELTGTDFGGNCYRYMYDIPSYVMGAEQTFQLNESPIDNSSISPATGLAKQLIGSNNVDSVTQDIVYEIYAKNVGNVRLDNFNITDNLGALFGAANVSNVQVSVLTNPSNLVLNPEFDGINNVKVFNDNQIMSNLQNGYISLQISLRATHLIGNKIYYNTAFSKGEIGNAGSRILVIDSSNNGNVNAIDPNADGDPGDLNENIPTPYYFGIILPVRFIDAKAARISNGLHNINWSIAPPPNPVDKFDVEYSEDNIKWQLAGTVAGEQGKNKYYLNFQVNSKNALYYRIWAYESNGKNYLSQVILVPKLSDEEKIKITPNPANEFVRVYSPEHNFSDKRSITIIDMGGKKIFDRSFLKQSMEINTSKFPDGYYVVNVEDKGVVFSEQMLVKH